MNFIKVTEYENPGRVGRGWRGNEILINAELISEITNTGRGYVRIAIFGKSDTVKVSSDEFNEEAKRIGLPLLTYVK